jgi:beta-lactamase regulating signal transducer with metallopeptidase domain
MPPVETPASAQFSAVPGPHESESLFADKRFHETDHATTSSASSMPSSAEILRAIVGIGLGVWLLGIVFLAARWCYGLHLIAALRRSSQPLDTEALTDGLNQVRQALDAASLPPMATSAVLDRPVMIGLFRPLVILPEEMLQTLHGTEWVDVLVHECAHAVCRHQILGFFQRLAGTAFWPHPLVHVLNRELARAREEVCDNYVLRRSRAPRYARTLLELSQSLVGVSPNPATLGLFHCRWKLEDRVADLLDQRRKVMIRVSRWTVAALTTTFLLVGLMIAGVKLVQAAPESKETTDAKPTVSKDTVSQTTVERRAIHKKVKDFPEKMDSSSPESVMAAWVRTLADKNIAAAQEQSWVKLSPSVAAQVEMGLKDSREIPSDFKDQLLNEEILEVFLYRDDFAAVTFKGDYPNKGTYGVQFLGRIGEIWKGIGYGDDAHSQEEAEKRFESEKDNCWQVFVRIRNEIAQGRTPLMDDPQFEMPAMKQKDAKKGDAKGNPKATKETSKKSEGPSSDIFDASAVPVTEDEAKNVYHFSVVIAKHVMLLEGKEIVTWSQIEEIIAKRPNPSMTQPQFYMTRSVIMDQERYESVKKEMWRLHKDYKLAGHSEGSFSDRANLRFDRIQSPEDLKPDESLRITGEVMNSKGERVPNAEIILVTPIDESIPYNTYDLYLANGHVRNPLEEVMTRADETGYFVLYPPKDKEFCVVALQPEAGIGFIKHDEFLKDPRVILRDWAKLAVLTAHESSIQRATLRNHLPVFSKIPEIVFMQEATWRMDSAYVDHDNTTKKITVKSADDPNDPKSVEVSVFTHVPPVFTTTINRNFAQKDGMSVSLPAASLELFPGESRQLDLGPLSEQQRKYLDQRRLLLEKRIQEQPRFDKKAEPQTPDSSNAPKPSVSSGLDDKEAQPLMDEFQGKVVDEAGKPVAGAKLWMPYLVDIGVEKSFEATTDSEGRYRLRVAHSIRIQWQHCTSTIWVYAPGYQLTSKLASTSDGVIPMPPATDTSFLVLDPEGNPVVDALVQPDKILFAKINLSQPTAKEALQYVESRTDKEGRARLPAIGRDTLRSVSVTTKEYGVQIKTFYEPKPNDAPECVIRLRPVGRVECQLTADNPEWLHGVLFYITTYSSTDISYNTEGFIHGFSDDQGRFVVPALAVGFSPFMAVALDKNSPVQPRLPKGFRVDPGETTRLLLPMERLVPVRGSVRVKQTGAPVPNATVHVYYGLYRQGTNVETDAEGQFTAKVLSGPVRQQAIRLPSQYEQLSSNMERSFEVPHQEEEFTLPPLEVVLKDGKEADKNTNTLPATESNAPTTRFYPLSNAEEVANVLKDAAEELEAVSQKRLRMQGTDKGRSILIQGSEDDIKTFDNWLKERKQAENGKDLSKGFN